MENLTIASLHRLADLHLRLHVGENGDVADEFGAVGGQRILEIVHRTEM